MRRSVLSVSLSLLAVHLAIAASIPLIDDEAYYALWARDPALGYYDHPPMIAYLIRAGTCVFGESPLGVRLLPVLCFFASGLLVADLARRLSDGAADVPVLATTLYQLGVLVFALGSFATPDAPSSVFWVAALWSAVRAIDTPPDSRAATPWWVCTGLLIGFGGLSKFTNAFLAVGLLAYLLATPKGRGYLLTRLPYMAAAAVILPLLPYLVWNLQNDWLGLERQGARLVYAGFSFRHLGDYALLLLLAPTPWVSGFALRALKGLPKDSALLIWSSVPLLAYFAYHATHAPIQANWIVPVQAAIAILGAMGLVRSRFAPSLVKVTLLATGLMSVGVLATALNPFTPIGTADNPPNQTRGWSATEAAIQEKVDATGATWIATTDYARTGSLALRFPHLRVWSVVELRRYGFRGAFPTELCTAPGLLIERAAPSATTSETAPSLFEAVGVTQSIVRSQDGVVLMRYHLTPVARVRSPELCAGW